MSAVSETERYRIVCARIDLHHQKIVDSFSLFIKLASALAAGIVWLRLDDKWRATWPELRGFAIGLFLLIALGTVVLILFNLLAWWGYCRAESELTGGKAPAPSFPRSCKQELTIFVIIVAASVLGVCFMMGLS